MSYLEENESNMTKVGGYFISLIQRSGNTFLKEYSHENRSAAVGKSVILVMG